MGKYFKPWRRKVGCVLMVIGAAFTGGWIRSLYVQDTILFPIFQRQQLIFICEGSVAWRGGWIEGPGTWVHESGPILHINVLQSGPALGQWTIYLGAASILVVLISTYLLFGPFRKKTVAPGPANQAGRG